MVWTSEKGNTLLAKISVEETGLVFDRDSYQLVGAEPDDTDSIALGSFETEREAALAYDRAVILISRRIRGDKLSSRGKRARRFFRRDNEINALKAGRERLH